MAAPSQDGGGGGSGSDGEGSIFMGDGSSGGSGKNTILESEEVVPRIWDRRNKQQRVASGDDGDVNSSPTMKYGSLSRLGKLLKSNDDLFGYFDDHLQGKEKELVCPGKSCK